MPVGGWAGSVPEVVELQRDTEILRLARSDDRLQVVALLPAHPQLIPLGLRADAFETEVLDELVDLLGVIGGDAGLDGQLLPGGATGRLFDLSDLEGLEGDLALDQLLLQDLVEGRSRSSVDEARSSSLSENSMDESVPLKSKRVAASRLAWSTAFRTSCMSTSETTSKVGMPKQ